MRHNCHMVPVDRVSRTRRATGSTRSSNGRLAVLAWAAMATLALVLTGCGATTTTGSTAATTTSVSARSGSKESATGVPTPTVAGSTGRAMSSQSSPPVKAALVGDSQVLALKGGFDAAKYPGFTPAFVTEFGCGIMPYRPWVDGATLNILDQCKSWGQTRRADAIAAERADVGALFLGGWEQYDRSVDGTQVPFSSTEWQTLTQADIAKALKEIHASTPHVALVLDHCHDAKDMGLPVQAQYQAGRYPPVVNDPARIAALNDAGRAAAAQVGFPVKVLDPNDVLCQNGVQESINGIKLREDGMHLTPAGADLVWQWLVPQLEEVARQ